LYGIIDLLYQDQSGTWHLVEWTTEWAPKNEIEEHAKQHLAQMAAYAQAIKQSLGVQSWLEVLASD